MKLMRRVAVVLLISMLFDSHVLLAEQAGASTVAVTPATGITVQAVGEVEQSVGLVKAVGVDNKERLLKFKSPIFPKDFIITAKDSYAGLRFTDGTLAVVRPLSAIQINQYKFAIEQPKNDNLFKINLDTGGISLSPGIIARTSFTAFVIQTPICEITPAGQTVQIAYMPNKGVAFIGMGKIHTSKGTKNVTQPSAITIDAQTQLSVQVSVIPELLAVNTETTAEQYLKSALKTYGEAAAFETGAAYNAQITPAQLSEDAVVASLNVDDVGNVTIAQTTRNTTYEEDDLPGPGDYAATSDDDGEAW